MKRFIFLLLLPLFFTSYSQNKQLTIEDAVIGQWRELYPKTMRNVQWKGKSSVYTFQDYQNVYSHTLNSLDSTIVLSINDLNSALNFSGLDSVRYMPQIKWRTSEVLDFMYKGLWVLFSVSENRVVNTIELPEGAENISLMYDKKQVAYTIENNLYVKDVKGKITAITSDKNKNIVNGQIVSRNEFGINSGIFWSPKGNFLAFYRKDVSKVGSYPLVDITKRQAELNSIKYPMAGMPSEHVSVGVYDFETGKTEFIEKNDTVSEKYLTNITWSPNESSIYIQVLNRDQNHMKLNSYNIKGKLISTLFEEKHSKYVEPLLPLMFVEGSNDKFIYMTRKDGYTHAYLYKTDGSFISQITKGDWEVTDIVDYDSHHIYYMSTAASPIESNFYRTNLNNNKTEKLTIEKGVHSVVLNKTKKIFIDRYSNTETPNKIQVVDFKGKVKQLILDADNPLTDYDMPKMEIGTLKSADGKTDLYYRLIKPAGFDPNKKYPAIVYVYGGPHAQLINNSWLGGARMWNYFMAQKGYVMLTIDNRGSSNRGLEFENVIHRQCGVNEMQDQMKGIDFLKKTGYVDMDRIGVHGWSYGGFLTTSLILNYPETFKVAVAGGPVIDWKYYEVMYGERYMDTPDQNPEGYKFTSLIPRAKDLKGKLMIVQGALDPVVVMQHSQLFVRECVKNKVPIDYFIYPRSEHNVRGYDRIHLMDKVTKYFDDYLR